MLSRSKPPSGIPGAAFFLGEISMANPQAENGHVDIANEIVEALARVHLTPNQTQILWAIFRKTYGWHKKKDQISLGQFRDMTGISKPNLCRALSELIMREIVIRTDNDNLPSYEFQKDYHKWKPLSKLITPSVINIDNQPLSGLITNKRNIIQKKHIYNNILSFSQKVVAYLNEKTGKNFKPKSKDILRLISARYSDGFTLENFFSVIDKKTAQWKDDLKMDAFLRPKTLFAAGNFESYLNERGTGNNGNRTGESWELRVDEIVRSAKASVERPSNSALKKISQAGAGSDVVEGSNIESF